jgi:anthranilate synthase component 1
LPREETGLPFRGGWALMLDYELAGQIETVLHLPARADGLPSALALRCPAAVLHDRVLGQFHAVCETDHADQLDTLLQDLAATATLPPLPQWQPPAQMEEDAPTRFTDGVGKVIDYLRAGDVFQVNLSRRWVAHFDDTLSPQALYAQLRVANPAPFAGLFIAQGRAVVSSSPERLVSVHGDDVQTRPIAGTRPRFAGDDDAERIRELVGHPKERAEHVMLIDLERNDLGRICTAGSVEVDELMSVESYAHVHHIVSNVCGRLRPGVSPGQVIAATFPGGTIAGSHAAFRTGAGIVVDSDPARELDETRAKARGLMRALGRQE